MLSLMDDKAVIRSFEAGFDKRKMAILAVILLAAGIVIGVVVAGVRGQHVQESAASLAQPKVPTSVPGH
jgi:hypothetical protein